MTAQAFEKAAVPRKAPGAALTEHKEVLVHPELQAAAGEEVGTGAGHLGWDKQ